jgi:fumarylacetoacetase
MAAGAAIPKNWFYVPSVYNSRVSSIIPSPQPVRRPRGVYFIDGETPAYGPSRQLDYELEMGYFVSKPVKFGTELNIAEADEHIFGFVLLNDWSSRDLQIFEMKPLGPFHAKGSYNSIVKLKASEKLILCLGFGTSISTWIVTMEALEPFRCSPKTKQDPPPFDHLKWPREGEGAIDINLQITVVREFA